MRILMYGWEFPPHISGGLGVACFGMTQALAEQGHDITFVLPRLKRGMSSPSHVNLLSIDGLLYQEPSSSEVMERNARTGFFGNVEFRVVGSSKPGPYSNPRFFTPGKSYVDMTSNYRKVLLSGSLDGIDWGPAETTGDYGPNLLAEILRYASAAGAIAAEVPHDIIHAHDWLTLLAGIEAKRISGKPLVVHIHALEFDRSGENVNQLVYDIERCGMEAADLIVAVSHYTKNVIVERYGVDPAKVRVVHNAVMRQDSRHRQAHKKDKTDRVVLFLGRITFQKGPDYFVEAARKVLEKREHVRFVMAGSGDMAPQMIERVAELGIGRKFHFTGFLRGDELEKIYEESDIYVMPSVSEPFGISPLEAMCYDVPVIISNQSGVSEVLTHALKFDFWDVNDLADKIIAMLDHSPLRDEMMVHGAEELKRIQWGNAATLLGDAYRQVQKSA